MSDSEVTDNEDHPEFDVWDAYVARHGYAPEKAKHLFRFSRVSKKVRSLSHKASVVMFTKCLNRTISQKPVQNKKPENNNSIENHKSTNNTMQKTHSSSISDITSSTSIIKNTSAIDHAKSYSLSFQMPPPPQRNNVSNYINEEIKDNEITAVQYLTIDDMNHMLAEIELNVSCILLAYKKCFFL